jgi:hypothetical protein
VICLLLSAALVVPLFMRFAGAPSRAFPGSLALYAMGLTTMFTQVMIIMGFQMASGYVYGWIAALIASFMLGMGIASSLAGLRGTPGGHRRLAALVSGLIALPLVTLLVLRYAGTHAGTSAFPTAELLFIGLALASGLVGGTLFAAASAALTRGSGAIVKAGALAYALDLAGATVAGFSTGFIILPALGIAGSAYVVAGFNAVLLAAILVGHQLVSRTRGVSPV